MLRLGQYQLLRKIGSGGMAEVWSARKPAAMAGAGDKFVAIKVLAPHLSDKPEYREMFLAEARLSMQLNHSNIVQVFDAIDDPPYCYMVMELIEGMTLAQLERALGKQGEGLPIEVSTYIIAELLRALAYAHTVTTEAGATIVHRDISPQNLMVTTSGEVKLMDFGIARFATEDTQGSFVKGKLQYMPPEQLRKETRKPTIDLFAVGAILHELVDGRRFRGKIEETRLLGMVINGEIPPLREGITLPLELDALRRGLLEPDEEARIPTAKEALQILYEWPGYKVASIELETLVQRFVAPSSSMSGPSPYVEDSGLLRLANESSGLLALVGSGSGSGSGSGVVELSSNSDLRKLDGRAAADTLEAGADQTPAGSAVALAIEGQPGWRKWALLIGAPAAFMVLGMILMLVIFGAKDEEPSVAAAPQPQIIIQAGTPTEQAPEFDKSQQKSVVDPVVDPLVDVPLPDPGAGLEPGLGTVELDDEEASVKSVQESVPVDFVANEFFFLYVKVGGKQLTLEPRARTKLAPGSHTVYLRSDREGKWTKAGKIEVKAGSSYRVEMRKPAGLELVEVDK